jgi:hypothetical protein
MGRVMSESIVRRAFEGRAEPGVVAVDVICYPMSVAINMHINGKPYRMAIRPSGNLAAVGHRAADWANMRKAA